MLVEAIPDGDEVSRHVDSPYRFNAIEREVLRDHLFEFPSSDGSCESLVWRKYAQSIADVHRLGCERQAAKRLKKPTWTYEGAVTATASAVRELKNSRGNGFVIAHDPAEGVHHVSITFLHPNVVKLPKSEKTELKDMLARIFSPIERHSCG